MDKQYFIENFKTVKTEEMIEYIENNAPEKKKEIAKISFGEDKKFNYMKFRKAFYTIFFPEIYEAKTKPSEVILSWLD